MKAIILAAGYGNRMRPLTDAEHKTLLTIANSTIIDRIVESLTSNGVVEIIVALGYRADELSDYLRKRYEGICHFIFVLNERYRETNNIHTLALVFEKCEIDDDIILIESDLIFETAVIERVIQSPYATVALVDRYRSGMDGTVVALEGNKVINVIPPHLQGSNFDFSDKYKTLNIYKFSRDFCQRDFKKILTYYARTIDDNCYYELILGILIYMHRENIYAESVEGLCWTEVDDPNDLRLAEFKFNQGVRKTMLDRAWGGFWSYPITDFAFIRNMHFPPDSAFSEIKNNLFELMTNYGSCQRVLNEKLSYWALAPTEKLVLLNGAAQAFPLLSNWLSGKKAAIPKPTFGEYRRIFPEATPYYDDGAGYEAAFLAACSRVENEVIVVVNPNNPTGSVIANATISNQIALHPEKFFIVDESFIDFSGEISLEASCATPVDNFVVVKSLSKVLGVPGVRLGYIFTHNNVLRQYFLDSLPVWNINSIAEFLLEILLKHRNSFKHSITQTIRDRDEFADMLSNSPAVAKVFSSGANFLLVRLSCSSAPVESLVSRLLDEYGIYAKSVSEKFDDGLAYLRIAVRSPFENAKMVKALTNVFMTYF